MPKNALRLHQVYLGLGSNIGDRKQHLEIARKGISEHIGKILLSSSLYLTEPWGLSEQPAFFNQVVLVESKLDPETVLQEIHAIERSMGRERIVRWDRRIIDIDILFYDHEIYRSEGLQIPHPWIEQRNFVLAPLAEIAPGFVHPFSKKTIEELLKNSPDPLSATPLEQ